MQHLTVRDDEEKQSAEKEYSERESLNKDSVSRVWADVADSVAIQATEEEEKESAPELHADAVDSEATGIIQRENREVTFEILEEIERLQPGCSYLKGLSDLPDEVLVGIALGDDLPYVPFTKTQGNEGAVANDEARGVLQDGRETGVLEDGRETKTPTDRREISTFTDCAKIGAHMDRSERGALADHEKTIWPPDYREMAFEVLMRRHYYSVKKVVLAFAGYSSDLDDVLQVSFFKAYKGLRNLEERSKFKYWVRAIALNEARDLAARKQASVATVSLIALPELEEARTPAEIMEKAMIFEELRQHLPERYMEVLYLRYFLGYRVKEVSELLGISPGLVKWRTNRAKKLAKEVLRRIEL